LTGDQPISQYQHTANNRNDPVPYSWQTSGPITLAADNAAKISKKRGLFDNSYVNLKIAIAWHAGVVDFVQLATTRR
jgi:hypothetical protein